MAVCGVGLVALEGEQPLNPESVGSWMDTDRGVAAAAPENPVWASLTVGGAISLLLLLVTEKEGNLLI